MQLQYATNSNTALVVAVVGKFDEAIIPASLTEQFASFTEDEKRQTWFFYSSEGGAYLLMKYENKTKLPAGEALRMLGGNAAKVMRQESITEATLNFAGDEAELTSILEGALLGDYHFVEFRKDSLKNRDEITLYSDSQAAVDSAKTTAECQNFARRLADLPANVMTPKSFIEELESAFVGEPVTIKSIVGVDALTKSNFPGLVQVGKAGAVEPAMLEIVYTPENPTSDNKLALVGKGITFDAGGISIKPSANMWAMKCDMGGAAAVAGAIRLIVASKPTVPVTAYFALAENMPDSIAVKPGDIYKTRNGKYINIDSCDAEGRLVLADVLTYAEEQGATHIVDVATLTGACLVALGTSVAAVLGNTNEFCQDIVRNAETVGESFWQLPLYEEYRKMLDHPHADLNNIGNARSAGTITAGLFLSEFVTDKVQWAHCDIAGPAFQAGADWRYYRRGATGFAVRSLNALAHNLG